MRATPISFVGNQCYKGRGASYTWTVSGVAVQRLDYSDTSCQTLHATHNLADVGACHPNSPFGGASYKISAVTPDSTTAHLTMGLFSTDSCTGGLSSTPGATTTGTVNVNTCSPKSMASGALIASAFKLVAFEGGLAWEEFDDAGCSTYSGNNNGGSIAVLEWDHCEPLGLGGKYVKQAKGDLATPTRSPTRSPTNPGATHSPTTFPTTYPTSYPTPPTRSPTRFPTAFPTPKQCHESSVNLVCHHVHAYPKQTCRSWCSAKGVESQSQSVYTQGSTIDIGDCTERWGGPFSKYPVDLAYQCPLFSNPATCKWSETTTTQTTDLYLALSESLDSEHEGGSQWSNADDIKGFVESSAVNGKQAFDLSSGEFLVKVSLRSIGGPVMQGRILTNGCGPYDSQLGEDAPADGCFGMTSEALIAWGIVLLCFAGCCICFPSCFAAVIVICCRGLLKD